MFEEASRRHPDNEELYARSLIAAEGKGGPDEVDKVWQRRSYKTADHVGDAWLVDRLMEVAQEADRRAMRYHALSEYSRVFGLTDHYQAWAAYDRLTTDARDRFDPKITGPSATTASNSLRRVFEIYPLLPLKPLPPQAAVDWALQGETDVRNRNYLAARDHYFQALQIAPWWPELHYNLGLVQWAGQDSGAARAEMNIYLYLDPQGKYAQDARRKAAEFDVRYQVKP